MNLKTQPDLTHPALLLLHDLLAVPAPSGREEQLAAVVRARLDELDYAHETDAAGNVLVRLPGRTEDAPLMVMAAHMDEIGMVVTRIEADGSLRVRRSGGLYPYKLGEAPVTIVGDHGQALGVLSMGSTHTADAASRQVTWDDVRLITGLTLADLRERGIRPGSTAVPVPEGRGPLVFGRDDDPLVAAWTFDDRAGVMTLLRLLECLKTEDLAPSRPVIVAFTVHEEGGCHGAKVLAHRERPEVFLAVDGCPMVPGTDLTLDHPCVWSKDLKAHYDQRLVRALLEAGEAAGVPLQTAVLPDAYSDASAVYDAGAVPRVGIVGHVRENSHGFEVTRLGVFDQLLEVLAQFITA